MVCTEAGEQHGDRCLQGFKKASGERCRLRAEVQGNFLVMSIGLLQRFHVISPGVAVAIESNGQKVVISGADHALVGKFASEVRS
jgi:ribosomal protein L6P/L9E